MDIAREQIVRDLAAYRGAPSGVLNFPVAANSDEESVDVDVDAADRSSPLGAHRPHRRRLVVSIRGPAPHRLPQVRGAGMLQCGPHRNGAV